MKPLMLALIFVALPSLTRTTSIADDTYESEEFHETDRSDESDKMDRSTEVDNFDIPDLYQEMVNVSDRSLNILDGSAWNEPCYPTFEERNIAQANVAIQGCSSYQVGRVLKASWEGTNTKSLSNVPSAEECHIFCLTFPECVAFKWSKGNNCYLLKSSYNIYDENSNFISGMRTSCTENMDSEVLDYFSNPDQRNIAAKSNYITAKTNYNREDASRKDFSRSEWCLSSLLKFGKLTDDELHTPSEFDSNEIPFLPLTHTYMTKTVSLTANSGSVKIPNLAGWHYQDWVMTGLYAPPGKVITVVTPPRALGQIRIQIGVHTDKLFNLDNLRRDPQVSFNFDINQATQNIGSPYGGLIVVRFVGPNDLSGETIDMRFDNIIDAPHFILGEHTNEDWNNHMKILPAPWTVFEIPKLITFIVPTRGENGVHLLEDVTTTLGEWKTYMERQDVAAGVIDRPAAEILVLDDQISTGSMHSGYPIMAHLYHINQIFPPDGRSVNNNRQSVGIGHEVGHNMCQRSYYLNHVTVNLFFFYSLPATRTRVDGTWGRESRIFGYIKNGEPDLVDSGFYDLWHDILKIPMDGTDGSGWEYDGNWDDLPTIIASYKDLPSEDRPGNGNLDEMISLWVKKVCSAKQMNMIKYFEFWKFDLSSPSIQEACNQYTHEPTEIMAWIDNIRHLAEDATECQEGWYGHSNKCFKLTERSFTYEGAKEYCEGLEGDTALATVADRADEILVDWTYFQSGWYYPFWVKNVPNHGAVFPNAEGYEVEAGSNTVLAIPEKRPSCQYKDTKQTLFGTTWRHTMRCLAPANKDPARRFKAMCQIVM